MKKEVANDIFFAEVERLLARGESVTMLVRGDSMRPLLRNGRDTVVVAPRGEAPLRVLDIVLFRYRGRHVLHRIVRIEGDRLTLAGDGNYRLRERCTSDDIVARMVCAVRPSGRIVECDSRRWRIQSRLWLAIPEWVRRQLLRIMWHLRIGR